MEKLTVVVASILCILIFAVAIVCVDIWMINMELDKWRRSTSRGIMIGEIIERYELMLRQKLIKLTLLVAATVTAAVVSFRSIRHKHIMKNLLKNLFYGLAEAFLITMMFMLIFYALLFLPFGYVNSLAVAVLSTIITGIIVVRILTDKWIIGLVAGAFDAILLYIGCFFLYWGAILHLFGTRITIVLGLLIMFAGVPAIVGGIMAASKLKGFLFPPKPRQPAS